MVWGVFLNCWALSLRDACCGLVRLFSFGWNFVSLLIKEIDKSDFCFEAISLFFNVVLP